MFNLDSLKNSRQKAGFTQKQVERSLNMRNLMMRDYELGRLKLPMSVAIELARLYNVSLEELCGIETNLQESLYLNGFRNFFNGTSFVGIYLDPIIRAYLEEFQESLLDQSIFDILTFNLDAKEKIKVLIFICHSLYVLACVDKKIASQEINCIRSLLKDYDLLNRSSDVTVNSIEQLFSSVPDSFRRIELKHYLIWLMFYFSYIDKKIHYKELEFIELIAQKIKVNRSNFLFIKRKFLKENK